MEPEHLIQQKFQIMENFLVIIYKEIRELPYETIADSQLLQIGSILNLLAHLHCPMAHIDYSDEMSFTIKNVDMYHLSVLSQIVKNRFQPQTNRVIVDISQIKLQLKQLLKVIIDLVDQATGLNINTALIRRRRLLRLLRRILYFEGALLHTDTLGIIEPKATLLKMACIHNKVAELIQSLQNYPHRLHQPEEYTNRVV